jgi:cytoskeleton protein RodZ
VTKTIDSDAMAASAGPGRATAGAKLKAAREAAGLSVDAIAQQLKLAPRQVKALEEDDFQRLPGRTFVRGFARNYARFVQLDPDAVLSLLPAGDSAPALERPALAAARRPMGEIPTERATKPSPARWLLPLLLALIVAAVGYYEYTRQHAEAPRQAVPASGTTSAPAAGGAPGAATTPTAAAPATGTVTTTLPNPVADPAAPAPEAKEAPAAAGTSAATAAAAMPDASSSPVAGESALILTFKGTSWAEVKDAHGRVILQMTGGAGMTQTVSGTPPLELALGNAPEVGVTFRGQSLDLTPYMRGNVARVALK